MLTLSEALALIRPWFTCKPNENDDETAIFSCTMLKWQRWLQRAIDDDSPTFIIDLIASPQLINDVSDIAGKNITQFEAAHDLLLQIHNMSTETFIASLLQRKGVYRWLSDSCEALYVALGTRFSNYITEKHGAASYEMYLDQFSDKRLPILWAAHKAQLLGDWMPTIFCPHKFFDSIAALASFPYDTGHTDINDALEKLNKTLEQSHMPNVDYVDVLPIEYDNTTIVNDSAHQQMVFNVFRLVGLIQQRMYIVNGAVKTYTDAIVSSCEILNSITVQLLRNA